MTKWGFLYQDLQSRPAALDPRVFLRALIHRLVPLLFIATLARAEVVDAVASTTHIDHDTILPVTAFEPDQE
jgi:hypothetical protein